MAYETHSRGKVVASSAVSPSATTKSNNQKRKRTTSSRKSQPQAPLTPSDDSDSNDSEIEDDRDQEYNHAEYESESEEESDHDQSQGYSAEDVDIGRLKEDDVGQLDDEELRQLEDGRERDATVDPFDRLVLLDYDSMRANILRGLPSGLAKEVKDFMSQSHIVSSRPNWRKDEYDSFVRKEVSLSGRQKEHLVQPSGDDAARLAIRLNYPTFTVSDPTDGSTMDTSNACIRILQRKGLDESIFWYETTYRREKPEMTEGGARKIPEYEAALMACYDSFSQACEDNASFKVVLLAGVNSGNNYKHRNRNTVESYELSGLEVWIHISRREDQDRRIARIAVSMPHPEAFLRALSGKARYPYKVARECDVAVNVAAALAGVPLAINEKYFSDFLAKRYSGPETVEDYQESPMSALMTQRRREIAAGVTTPFGKLPLSIIRYVQKELRLDSVEDVKASLSSNNGDTFLQVAHRVMYNKSWRTREELFYKRMTQSSVEIERTVLMKRGEELQTICGRCRKYRTVDLNPLFGTRDEVAQVYIARTTEKCPSKECAPNENTKSRTCDLVPRNEEVKYITRKSFRALVNAKKKLYKKKGGKKSKLCK